MVLNNYKRMLENSNAIKVSIIPYNNWLYCHKCGKAMKVVKTGVPIVATSHEQYAWCDLYECENCGCQVLLSGKRCGY
ncbi:MAG: hypothetical protein ACTSPI_10155 [Candidatus Heimdallarchaeaceae archaeon]